MSLLADTSSGSGAFPEKGFESADIERRLAELCGKVTPDLFGAFSVHALADNRTFMPESRRLGDVAFDSFKRFNALFSAMEPPAGAIEDDVMNMCVEIFNGGEDGRCNITLGGTESIYCAMLAMREWASVNRPAVRSPEFVAPVTAHIAFSRAAHNFGLRIRRVPLDSNYRVDLDAMRSAISPDTIGIVGSAPNWPHGIVEPIPEIAALAKAEGLWMHVDACVGGYLAPFAKLAGYDMPDFDLSVDGVCSLSADLHKYGYVPKPCSTVLWQSEDYQRYHYYAPGDWPCGTYFSQSLIGSRPFAPTAAAWAILNSLGREGFIDQARRIMETKGRLVDGIRKIEGLDPWDNDLALLVVSAVGFDIEKVIGGLHARGWVTFGTDDPPSLHLTVDPMPPEGTDRFLDDLAEVTESIRRGDDLDAGSLDYGVAHSAIAPVWYRRAVKLIGETRFASAASDGGKVRL